MLFKNSKKRFNCGDGNSLSKINNPCNFSVADKSLNSISNTDNTVNYNTVNYNTVSYNTTTYNTFSLKNNMTFCMIPKPRCNKCKK